MSVGGAALLRELRRAEQGFGGDDEATAILVRHLQSRRSSVTRTSEEASEKPGKSLLRTYLDSKGDVRNVANEEVNKAGASLTTTISMSHSSDRLPAHLRKLKTDLEFMNDSQIHLPVVQIQSPRSRRRAAALPPPNAAGQLLVIVINAFNVIILELAKLEEYFQAQADDPYHLLVLSTDKQRTKQQRAQLSTGKTHRLGTSLVTPLILGLSVASSKLDPGASGLLAEDSRAAALFARAGRVRRRKEELARGLASDDIDSRTPHVTGAAHGQLDALVAGVFDDLGVNLDAEYNRMRQVQVGVRVLLHFWRRLLLRNALVRLCGQTRLASTARLLNATLLLSRFGRGLIARLHMRDLRANMASQRRVESERRKTSARRSLSVVVLVALFFVRQRGFLFAHRNQRLQHTVVTIQRALRGHHVRARVEGARRLAAQRDVAATRVQCAYRMRLARRRRFLLRKISIVLHRARRTLMVEEARRLAFYARVKRSGAALVIMRAYKASVIRFRLHMTVHWNHVEKAILVQKLMRGLLARRAFASSLKDEAFLEEMRHDQATKIASRVRGMQARRRFPALLHTIEQKRLKRQLFKLLVFSKRHWFVSKLTRNLKEWLHSLEPFRYIKLRRAAVNIERVWRGFKARRRVERLHIYNKLGEMVKAYERPKVATLILQSIVRGFLVRRQILSRGRGGKAVVLQCFWRRILAARVLARLEREADAGRTLHHYFMTCVLARRLKARMIQRMRFRLVFRIQRLARRVLFRWRLRVLRIRRRQEAEQEVSLALHTIRVLAEQQLRLLVESMNRPIGRAVIGSSGRECALSGPLQAMCVNALGSHARRDKDALVTNRIELKRLCRLLERVRGLLVAEKGRGKTGGAERPAAMYDLASSLSFGALSLPEPLAKLSSTDLDLIYSKCSQKNGLVMGKGIAYTEFIAFMEEAARIHYQSSAERLETESYSNALAAGHAPGLALLVRSMLSVHHESWFSDVAGYLQEESRARIGLLVRRVQGMVRRRISVGVRRQLMAAKQADRLRKVLARRVVLCQSVLRRFIHRRRAVRVAQLFLVMYVPFDGGLPYWFNSSTRVSRYSKPMVLGSFDCRILPLCPTGFETIVKCCNCGKVSKKSCAGCQESYCESCFESLHCKGSRRRHVAADIPLCTYCNLQQATRSCITCVCSRPRHFSADVLFAAPLGRYCDSCFTYHHEPADSSRYRARHHILTHSRDLLLVRQELSRRPATTHHSDALLQTCEECQWRASAHRCLDCDQVYCSPCLSGLHSRGSMSRHRAEPLPYYTVEMHRRFLRDAALREERLGVAHAQEMYAALFWQWHAAAVLRVQTWWRTIFFCRRGRAHMKTVRQALRRAFRVRVSDSKHFREKPLYRMKDIFGWNSQLKSDTRDEIALGSISVFGRQRARTYIWPNKEDWGHFVISRAEPRKGVPKEGFHVGTLEELCDQARRGGWRLPGRVHRTAGSKVLACSLSLLQFELTGCYVRVEGDVYLVRVVSADGLQLFLDRKVIDSSSPEGHVLYRLPSKVSEAHGLYYAARHQLYDSLDQYAVSQVCIWTYAAGTSVLSRVAMSLSQLQTRLDEPKRAARWATRAEALTRSCNRAMLRIRDKEVQEIVWQGVNPVLSGAFDALSNAEDSIPPWIGNHAQVVARSDSEAAMSEEQLLAEAENWLENYNAISKETCFIHKITREMTFDVPAPVRLKKERAAANDKRRMLDAKRKQMNRLAGNKL